MTFSRSYTEIGVFQVVLQKTFNFLGWKISVEDDGVKMKILDTRLKFFKTIKKPETLKQLQVVLGVAAHLSSTLPNYYGLCQPLIKLLRSKAKTKLVFNEAENQSWNRLVALLDASQVNQTKIPSHFPHSTILISLDSNTL